MFSIYTHFVTGAGGGASLLLGVLAEKRGEEERERKGRGGGRIRK